MPIEKENSNPKSAEDVFCNNNFAGEETASDSGINAIKAKD